MHERLAVRAATGGAAACVRYRIVVQGGADAAALVLWGAGERHVRRPWEPHPRRPGARPGETLDEVGEVPAGFCEAERQMRQGEAESKEKGDKGQ